MTARTPKQGGLATQQGDVVANVIAAAAGVPTAVSPYSPVLRAMLLTGADPLYLSSDASTEAPWWPPHKIVGLHLGPFLATHAALLVTP
jgi:hypothetical protein